MDPKKLYLFSVVFINLRPDQCHRQTGITNSPSCMKRQKKYTEVKSNSAIKLKLL